VVFFPYWTVESPFLTVWRIVNANDLNDPILTPVVADEKDPAYDANPLHLRVSFRQPPDCAARVRSFPFSPFDYRLIVVNAIRGIEGSGWAWGQATIRAGGGTTTPASWDRFFSDTVIVNTAEGWARGWHNYQHELGLAGARGTPMVVPSNFFSSYFTRAFRFGGARASDTLFSVTPVEIFEPSPYDPGENAGFGAAGIPDFDYDAILYDADETPFSVPTGRVLCQEVLSIHDLTAGKSRGLPQGWVHFWALDPPGEPDPNNDGIPFNPAGGDDWDGAAVLSWDAFPGSGSGVGWGYWTTHDKTAVDDRDLYFPLADDFDPEAP
jgi:hypothetical protein